MDHKGKSVEHDVVEHALFREQQRVAGEHGEVDVDTTTRVGAELLRLQGETGAWWTRQNGAEASDPLRRTALTEGGREYFKGLRPVPV